jgi:hypothetical protein
MLGPGTRAEERALHSRRIFNTTERRARRPSESSQDGLLTRHAVSAEAGFSKAPD